LINSDKERKQVSSFAIEIWRIRIAGEGHHRGKHYPKEEIRIPKLGEGKMAQNGVVA